MSPILYKSCMVPLCKSTTVRTPDKIFIHVPNEPTLRKSWLAAVKRSTNGIALKAMLYCCEDHFDLPNDMQNWLKYQLMPNTPKIMKKGVVPHKFDCQFPRTQINSSGEQTYVINKKKLLCTSNLTTGYAFNCTNIKDIKNTSLETTLNLIKKQSMFYIGVPQDSFYIINVLSRKTKIPEKDILLCLEKIKRDIGLVALAHDFDTTKQLANECFNKLIPDIAHELKKYIFWPESDKIFHHLPRSFRLKYNQIQSIINCLEINIPEPKTTLKKSISWSDSKKCYTYKYLISSTPDGQINFVSSGYGGRISDALLLEVSGFLDVIPSGIQILAEGFKNINELLLERDCKLRRLPTMIETTPKISRLETNRIAALKSHTESVITSFQDFQFLQPYGCIDRKFISLLDEIVLIVAALINVQSSIINK